MLRAYFNQRAAIWDERIAEKDTGKLAQMSRRLNISPGSRVLDVGTGTGIFISYLLKELGNGGRIIATDIAEEMLQKARVKSYHGAIDYVNADVTHIPLLDESVDIVVCYSSFPHIQDKSRALREMYRVVKSGGHLYICHTSSREAINGLHNGIPEVANDVIPEEWEMHLVLSEAGFTDIDIEDNCENYLCRALKKG